MPLTDLLQERVRPAVSSLVSHRILLYTVISTIAVSATITNALKSHSNFYSVAIYLSKSNRSVLILANYGALIALMCGRVVQHIFFGALRPAEVERLYDRLWFFVTESLLAFTIFRDEFDIPFALMFGFLLFVKSFHWVASDRIEWMDQRPYPGPSTLFHVRMSSLFVLLWLVDTAMLLFAVENTLRNGVGGMILFASEYAILMASALNITAKYVLSLIDFRRARQRGGEDAPPWENKSMWIFYIELATDFLKLSTYLLFFLLIITFYGLPLNIVRDVYVTARSFITRLRALQRYQAATRNMDQRYPDATDEEMAAMSDRTCIICREEMVLRRADNSSSTPAPSDGPNTTPKKLPCGHIFHFYCLRSWLERQQSCPTCRRTVLDSTPRDQQGAGARAQAPRPFRNVGPQPGQGGNPLGGMFGRIFGNPPGNPFANGPIPQLFQNNNVVNQPHIPRQGGVGPHPGVVIQYNIQYHLPRDGEPVLPQPRQPQAFPPFPGFQGPGGVWQPWGMDPQWFEPQHHEPPAPSPAPAPTPTPPQTTTQEPGQTETPQNASPSPTAADDSSSTGQSNPREAAAQAALRRFGLSDARSSSPSVPRVGSDSDGTNDTSTASPSNPANNSSTSSVSHESSTARGSGAQDNSNSRLKVPFLIPLDGVERWNTLPGASIISPEARAQGTPDGVRQARSDTVSRLRYPHATPPAPTSAHVSNDRSSQLPAVITDEQLALMDRLTRAAIDERLRILEGVSSTISRCIEDLMRVRSTLPDATSGDRGSSAPGAASTSLQSAHRALDTAISDAQKVTESQSKESEPSLADDASTAGPSTHVTFDHQPHQHD